MRNRDRGLMSIEGYQTQRDMERSGVHQRLKDGMGPYYPGFTPPLTPDEQRERLRSPHRFYAARAAKLTP